MRLLSNLHVKGKPAVLPDRAIRRQSHYFIYRPRICVCTWFLKQVTFNLIFIGAYIIVIVEDWKTNLMSLVILFRLLCAQHVSDINTANIRSLQLCCWITTSVVLFSVRCVLKNWCGSFWVVLVLQASATQSQAPDDDYINVRNMLST